MKKVTVLTFLSIGLLAANIFLIWHIVARTPPHLKKNDPKNAIIKKLQLDKKQIQEYDVLIDAHRTSIRQQEQHIRLLKNKLYQGLETGNERSDSDSLMAEVGKVQVNLERINFQHFEDIKRLCRPNQLTYFNELTSEIVQLFERPHPPRHEK